MIGIRAPTIEDGAEASEMEGYKMGIGRKTRRAGVKSKAKMGLQHPSCLSIPTLVRYE